MGHAVIIDVETTGLDAKRDVIIEVGLLKFYYSDDFSHISIVDMYGGLENPGFPIPDEIQRITGITDEEISGCQIRWDLVRQWLVEADFVVAHNMKFDRGFVEAREELKDIEVHWACSSEHVGWKQKGYKTRALNYLAADHGFVNPFAHRALFDCATTFRIVKNHLEEMLKRSYENEYRVYAYRSPFESKDVLKKFGYHWDPNERVWSRTVAESELENERAFLAANVYPGGESHHQEILVS